MSSSSLSSSGQHNSSQNDHQPPPSPKLRFQSNLAAVLNDPYKDRNKVPYLFTKTWGNDFTDSVHLSSINNIHPNYKNFKPNEFKAYLNEISDRQLKHSKNKLELIKSKNTSQKLLITRLNELEQIPKIFFDSNFSLSDKETFNSLISLKIFENSTGDNSTVVKSSNGLINASSSLKFEKNKLDQTESRKFILDKLGFYLDIIETQITNQITTKANTFFNAIHSQDEVQEHVLKTCTAVKGLRKNLNYLNERIVVASIKIIRLINLKIKYRAMLEKLELMSSIHQTKSTIELHLDSAEFTGALDLITMSQDILRQELRGIRSLRNFETQFNEADKTIDKSLHDEFVRYLISDLSRDFSLGSQLVNEEKLTSLILGILRLRSATFIDLCKDEILIYLKSTVKQTVVEYVSEFDEEALSQNEDESNLRLIDRIRKLKMPEFLHLLSKVLSNLKTMLSRAKTIIQFLIVIINAAAGVNSIKDNNSDEHENENQIVNRVILTKELINKTAHAKLVQNLTDLLSSSTDYAQERLVNLLDGKFKANELERLSTNDFVSLSNIIDEFILEFDQIANKKTSSLRSWLQNQANKFLHKFHNEKKDKITLALDSESWKQQNEVSSDFQNLVDHIIRNGLGTTRKYDSKSKGSSEVVMLFNEKYAIFGSVIVLVKIMDEYCQFTNDIPNLCYDAMTRLIEIFTIYNSKTYKMILGGGAFDQGILKLITFKTLVITYRSLELVLKFLPILKEFFKERLSEKQSITEKQFTKIIGDYEEHLVQLNSKLIFMMDEIFRESLSSYQVIAPVPSECFRSICNQINRVHAIVIDILAEPTLIRLFTDIHEKFKTRLKDRLKELNVVNDGGPKHALIFQDMTHYIKQFKNLNGLRTITINFLDVWES